MRELSASGLAGLAGVTEAEVERLVELGILVPRDGAGPFRLFWSIVLPMSRPILGVVSVFAVIATWKDYLWPLLVLRDPELQPLSVRLPILAPTTDLGVFIAALTISSLIPIALFLLFQRLFLSGAGVSGALKG